MTLPAKEPPPLDPLTATPPQFAPEEASDIAQRIFGVTGTTLALDSERDQNIRLVSEEKTGYLLKLSNPADDAAVLDLQTQAMLHIRRQDPALPVMQPLPTLDGGYWGEVEGPDGCKHFVRLFTFVDGRTVDPPSLGRHALGGFGAMVGRMGLALRGLFHPAGGYKILWDLKHTPELREFVDTVENATRRSLVEEVLDRFERRAGPALPGMRAQLIHNDLTLDNVLLDRSLEVSGIVDFGDLTHTALICDLAVSLVSLMWGRHDPLEAAEAVIGGYTSTAPIEDGEADVLADLVSARLAALVVIANWRVRSYPENAQYIRANEELAWALLGRLEALGPSAVERRMHAACAPPRGVRPSSRPLPSSSSVEDLVSRRQRVLGPALSPLSYDRPLLLERAEGINMFDREGNPYLDAYNNVPVVGHSHPRVAEAIAEQTGTLNTNTRYLHESVVELAERLVATMPDGLDTVMFVNSGSEANDIAWRFATAYTGGAGAIVTERAYHGVTTTTLALSPEEWLEVPEHVHTTPPPDGYRGRHRKEERGWAESYAALVGQAAATLHRRGLSPAACYMDPLFTSDGIFAPPPGYLEEVTRQLHQAGSLFIADEVQAGFGRTGAHLWSFQASGITPDLVTLGKPMGNGYPVAAVVMRSEIAQRLASQTDLFSTFGGNPVACRAALAVLDVIEDEALQHRAAEVGAYLRDNLTRLTARHGSIGDVRGAGLMIGVELVADVGSRSPASRLAAAVVNRMREKGVLVGSTGPDNNVLKIRPPLVLTSGDADVIVAMLDESLDELAATGAQGV